MQVFWLLDWIERLLNVCLNDLWDCGLENPQFLLSMKEECKNDENLVMEFREQPSPPWKEIQGRVKWRKKKKSPLTLHFYWKYLLFPVEFNMFSSIHHNNNLSQNTSTDAPSNKMFWQSRKQPLQFSRKKVRSSCPSFCSENSVLL